MTNQEIQAELVARGITALDLEDTVEALLRDQLSGTAASHEVEHDVQHQADALSLAGLEAQLAFMRAYYATEEHLLWALAGYLNLPLAA